MIKLKNKHFTAHSSRSSLCAVEKICDRSGIFSFTSKKFFSSSSYPDINKSFRVSGGNPRLAGAKGFFYINKSIKNF